MDPYELFGLLYHSAVRGASGAVLSCDASWSTHGLEGLWWGIGDRLVIRGGMALGS